MFTHVWQPTMINNVMINTCVTAAERARLEELARGKKVLEVGSSYGYSTVVLANVAELVMTIDPWKTEPATVYEPEEARAGIEDAIANYKACGVAERIALAVGRSQDMMPKMVARGMQFDLIWIDGDHSLEGITSDLECAKQLRAEDGVIAVHDYGEVTCPDVMTAIDSMFPGEGRVTDTLWEWPVQDGP
jgi:predicted O-methyltransferase YrrM